MKTGMKIGYARVSTGSQSFDLQTDALKAAGCERIFTDCASGVKAQRPGLDEALDFLRKGDVLVVWQMDRLGRSVHNMLELITLFKQREIAFISLRENFDTSTATGRMFFTVMLALSEFERNLMIERTRAGLEAAKARGRKGGRPPLEDHQIEAIVTLAAAGKSNREIGKSLVINPSTVWRYIKKSQEMNG